MMFYAVLALSMFFFVAITIAVIYFVIKYRHRPGHKAEPSSAHNDALEITWTVIPTIICVFLFYYGWRAYIHIVTPPQKAVEINVARAAVELARSRTPTASRTPTSTSRSTRRCAS